MLFRTATHYALTFLAISLYLLCALLYLDLPGLYYDEVLFANAAMGNIDGSFVAWSLPLGEHHFPLMLANYAGAVKAYLYAPIFALWGTTATTTRLPMVLAGLATLIFTYAVVRTMFSEKVGLSALLLLASDPTFIFANRLDLGPVAPNLLLKMSSLYLLWRWLNGGKLYLLGLASFLLGVGVYDKIIFLWYLVALLLALPLCFWPTLKLRISRRTLRIALACFMLGCLPLLAYNVRGPGRTFKHQKVVNTSPLAAFKYRFHVFWATLNGSAIYQTANREPLGHFAEILKHKTGERTDDFVSALAGLAPLERTVTPLAAVFATSVILLLWIMRRLEVKTKALFFVLLFLFMNVFMYATAQATSHYHVLTVYPLPPILIAIALWNLAEVTKTFSIKRAEILGRIGGVVCVIILMFTQIVIDARYLKSFRIKGGVGLWSDAIYELAKYALEHPDQSYVLMDWGFNNQLLMLSQGRIRKSEAFLSIRDASNEAEKLDVMSSYFNRPDAVLVFHAPGYEAFPALDVFKQALARHGFEAQIIKTFYQRDGQAVYLLYKVRNPEVEAYLAKGGFFYLREAEEWDAKSGGAVAFKPGASLNKVLGTHWGKDASHFVSYRFSLPPRISDGYLYLSYAFDKPTPQSYYLYLDDHLIDTLMLEPTRGDGSTRGQWKLFKLNIGPLQSGAHELKLKPTAHSQMINLDYFYLCERDWNLRM